MSDEFLSTAMLNANDRDYAHVRFQSLMECEIGLISCTSQRTVLSTRIRGELQLRGVTVQHINGKVTNMTQNGIQVIIEYWKNRDQILCMDVA